MSLNCFKLFSSICRKILGKKIWQCKFMQLSSTDFFVEEVGAYSQSFSERWMQ